MACKLVKEGREELSWENSWENCCGRWAVKTVEEVVMEWALTPAYPWRTVCYVLAGFTAVLEAGHFIFFFPSCDRTPDTSHLSKKGLTLAGRLRRDTVPQGEESLEAQTWDRWTGCTCSKETERRQEEKPGCKNPRLSLWPISSRGALLPKSSTAFQK